MKIRQDFVTNSSSSSYIISTKDEITDDWKRHFKLMTKENYMEYLKEYTGTWYSPEDDIISKIVAKCKLTPYQTDIVHMFYYGGASVELIDSVEAALDNKDTLYYISIDNNFDEELYRYFDTLEGKLIAKEHD